MFGVLLSLQGSIGSGSHSNLLIISAGFDAHYRDPLAGFNLETDDFSYMTKRLQEIQHCLLFGLEGGYDLHALGECCEAVADVLINDAGVRTETKA